MSPPPSNPAALLQARIPAIYRIFLLWIEPFAALNGAFMAAFVPDSYLSVMTPLATPLSLSPQFSVVLDQLAATYLLFAFIEAVVLRTTSELRVWKAVLAGIVLCDLVHLYATGRALGGWEAMLNPRLWRAVDWVNLSMLYGPVVLRLAFIFEVGFDETGVGKTKKA